MAKAAICKCSSKKVFLKIHRKTHEYCEIFKNSFFNRTLPVVACEMRTLAQNELMLDIEKVLRDCEMDSENKLQIHIRRGFCFADF